MESEKKMKITKKTNINKILEEKPELAEKFFKAGMMCVGCPMSSGESLEQGCKAHGMTKKEIDDLVRRLNGKVGGKKK